MLCRADRQCWRSDRLRVVGRQVAMDSSVFWTRSAAGFWVIGICRARLVHIPFSPCPCFCHRIDAFTTFQRSTVPPRLCAQGERVGCRGPPPIYQRSFTIKCCCISVSCVSSVISSLSLSRRFFCLNFYS